MRFMGGNVSNYDNQIVRNVIEKMNDNFDLSEKLDELSVQERYVYIGICTGINTIVTMTEANLKERSASVLNEIFGTDLFAWTTGEETEESEEITEDVIEDVINMATEQLVDNVLNEEEKKDNINE